MSDWIQEKKEAKERSRQAQLAISEFRVAEENATQANCYESLKNLTQSIEKDMSLYHKHYSTSHQSLDCEMFGDKSLKITRRYSPLFMLQVSCVQGALVCHIQYEKEGELEEENRIYKADVREGGLLTEHNVSVSFEEVSQELIRYAVEAFIK